VSDHPQAAAVRASFTHVVGSALRRSADRRNVWQHHPRQRVLSRLSIHRKYLVVGAVDPHQQVVLPPRRFGYEAFSSWATTNLGPSDAVVLEATSNAWLLYDELEPLVGSVTVAHPLAVKLIAAARVKTDSRDTIKLAHEAFCQFGAGRLGPAGVCARTARAGEPPQASRQPAHASAQSLACGPASAEPHAATGPAVCRTSAGMVARIGPLGRERSYVCNKISPCCIRWRNW